MFKGGYFKLPKEIKKANEQYKEISYIIKILKEVDLKTYQKIRNKGEITKLAKIHQKFYSLLQYHKDHKPLLQKIFCVFNYDSNFFMCHFEKILLWLTSPKFQTYLDTNHPYPPLLNPLWFKENIESSHFRDSTPILSYQDIPAEVAWEINLPLPRRYNAIVAFFGLSGHLALISFMIRCGASIHCLSNGKSLKIDYQIAYKTLLENKINFLIHVNYMQSKNSRKHILSLVDARVPALILLRDPLGRLKHGINHGWYKNNLTHYTLNQIKESVDRVTYEGQNKPHLDLLESAHENKNIGSLGIWEYYQTIKELRNITSVQYINMQEIVGKRTFETMKRLSKEFGFPTPKEENRKFYESKINNQYRFLLPIIFKINEKIKILIQQNICGIGLILNSNLNTISIFGGFLATKNSKDVLLNDTNSILQNNIELIPELNLDSFGMQIKIFINKNQWYEILCQPELQSYIKIKLQEYLFTLKEKIQSIESNKVAEFQILEYLKEHSETRKIYKSYFDQELIHIKSHRPDIVESWKYYQEFEKMCAEMDSC